jgi:hypothetical protein
MGNKRVKVLLGVVFSVGIFIGMAAFVADAHPLGGSQGPYARQQACIERNRYSGLSNESCYDEYLRATERIESKERWIAIGAGAAAVALFWLLVHFLYLRPRRRRSEQEADAA